MGNVIVVAQHELQGVRSRFEVDAGFRLSLSKMYVLIIGRE